MHNYVVDSSQTVPSAKCGIILFDNLNTRQYTTLLTVVA